MRDFWKAPKEGGIWLPEKPTRWLEGWNFQSYTTPQPQSHPNHQGAEGPWRLTQLPTSNDLINHACVMKPP